MQQHPGGTGWGVTYSALEQATALGLNPSGLVSVHNSYFQMLYELGWFAIPVIVLLMLIPLLAAARLKAAGIGAGLAATVIVGTLTHFAESAIFGTGQPYPYVFWLATLAAIVTYCHQLDDPNDEGSVSAVEAQKAR